MDYSVLNSAIAEIKELEERGAFTEALSRYESLLDQDPDEARRQIIALGKATTLITMNEAQLALVVLEQVSFDGFEPSMNAITYNVRVSALQQCERYSEALYDAIRARRFAESAPEIDPEIVSEPIAGQGFALASLGQVKQAIELFDLAETMALEATVRASIHLFRDYCHERAAGTPVGTAHLEAVAPHLRPKNPPPHPTSSATANASTPPPAKAP
jgi:tetratricopeptide (TPR) repeat protein